MELAGAAGADSKARTGLGWLLGARLLLAGMSLALAVVLDRVEAGQDGRAVEGVYWTVIAAFLATIVSARMVPRTRDPARFATLQVAFDVLVVTSLVYFSGGGESVFSFLYALVILYGALFLDRNGVGFISGLAALGYGFVLFGAELGWLPHALPEERTRPLPVLAAYWGFHAGALLLLGMLANTLSAELRRTGAALDRRTTDLRRLRDLHLRTVESIGSGLVTIDEAGCVSSFNPEAERITGLSVDQALGRPLDALIPGAEGVLREPASHIEGDPGTGRGRLAYHNERGEELHLGLAASSLRDEQGERVGEVVIFQDVTAVVSMEQELRRSERLAAVGEMAARIAHEIRNPLASISGSVQVLQSAPGVSERDGDGAEGAGQAEDPERERLMGIVVREVDRLNGLIGDFLLYSRPSPTKSEPVQLAGLIEEVAEVGGLGRDDGVEIRLELDRDVVVLADPDQLKAIVWNLWNNAIEAMDGRGGLSARVRRLAPDAAQGGPPADRNEESGGIAAPAASDPMAILEIEDTGPGIPPDVQERIFEPFFTTKREGTGLGLATVQRLVEQHGGSIQVSSGAGGGACFRVLLACAEPR